MKNPNVDRIRVELNLYSLTLTSEDMSSISGAQPTGTQAAILHRKDSTGQPIPPVNHGFFISTDKLCDSTDLDDHVAALMERLGDVKGVVDLLRNPEVNGRIIVLQWWTGHADCSLSSASMMALGSIPVRTELRIMETEPDED
jgi:hypothetical protein